MEEGASKVARDGFDRGHRATRVQHGLECERDLERVRRQQCEDVALPERAAREFRRDALDAVREVSVRELAPRDAVDERRALAELARTGEQEVRQRLVGDREALGTAEDHAPERTTVVSWPEVRRHPWPRSNGER